MTMESNGNDSRRVSVLSVGAWGLVLASHLARKGHCVTGYDFPPVIEALNANRSHPKLPRFDVPSDLRFTADLKQALVTSRPECVVVTTPGHGIRAATEKCKAVEDAAGTPPVPWVLCSKSIEEETLLPMAELVTSVRGASWRQHVAVLSGPSFAAEVALGKPTTVCAASASPALAQWVQDLFRTDAFRVYTQDDVLGVELGGSLKNVIAIAAGVCDGLELGDNARAALITRGLAEMVRLGVAMGARAETFAGLTGMGDLILTCGGRLSRNHQFGELLAKGKTCQEAKDEIGMVVEGARTARSVHALAERHGVDMPISRQIYAVVYEDKRPAEAVADLMRRDPRPERDPEV